MIPTGTTSTITGNLSGEIVGMSVDANSLVHLMGVLTDMYSNLPAALVREYATNAIDSHSKVGSEEPIEIWTPNNLNPNLVIQDFGEGMNAEDIRTTYSLYGASTKRNTNDQSGCLGIGGKSALAYGSRSFVIEAVKDGVKTIARAEFSSRNPSIVILSEDITEDRNGVKITIPVPDRYAHDSFRKHAKSFQKFSRFPVLVDGVNHEYESEWIGDRFRLFDKNYYGGYGDVVVMGNVAYPINGNRSNLHGRKTTAIYVDMGEVDFTPSREDLAYTQHTNATLDKYTLMFDERAIQDYQDKIDQIDDPATAFKTAYLAHIRSGYHGEIIEHLNYRGEEFPQTVIDDVEYVRYNKYSDGNFYGVGRSQSSKVFPSIEESHLSPMVFIEGYCNKAFTKIHLMKTVKYLQDAGVEHGGIYTCRHDLAEYRKWYNNDVFVDWEDIKKIKVNAPSAKGAKPVRQWEFVDKDRGDFDEGVLDPAIDTYYTSRQEINSIFGLSESRVAKIAEATSAQIALVIPSQEERFLKQFPKAKPIKKLIESYVRDFEAKLTKEDREAVINYSYYRTILPLDPKDLLDESLHSYCSIETSRVAGRKSVVQEVDFVRRLANGINIKNDLPKEGSGYDDLQDRYPLLPSYFRGDAVKEHAVLYLNAVYLASKEKK